MEEADALCNNIGIMVNGKLKTIGSPQELKGRYGTGYRVFLRTDGSDKSRDSADELMKTTYPRSELMAAASSQKLRVYEVPSEASDAAETKQNETGGEDQGQDEDDAAGEHQPETENGGFDLASFFGIMEKSKAGSGILDYSVSQTTMDQVFTRFAATQTTAD